MTVNASSPEMQFIVTRLTELADGQKELRDAVVRLARFEERLTAGGENFARHARRLELIETRLQQVEHVQAKVTTRLTWSERLIWLMVSGGGIGIAVVQSGAKVIGG